MSVGIRTDTNLVPRVNFDNNMEDQIQSGSMPSISMLRSRFQHEEKSLTRKPLNVYIPKEQVEKTESSKAKDINGLVLHADPVPLEVVDVDPEKFFTLTNHKQRFQYTRALFARMEEQSRKETELRKKYVKARSDSKLQSMSPIQNPMSPTQGNNISLLPASNDATKVSLPTVATSKESRNSLLREKSEVEHEEKRRSVFEDVPSPKWIMQHYEEVVKGLVIFIGAEDQVDKCTSSTLSPKQHESPRKCDSEDLISGDQSRETNQKSVPATKNDDHPTYSSDYLSSLFPSDKKTTEKPTLITNIDSSKSEVSKSKSEVGKSKSEVGKQSEIPYLNQSATKSIPVKKAEITASSSSSNKITASWITAGRKGSVEFENDIKSRDVGEETNEKLSEWRLKRQSARNSRINSDYLSFDRDDTNYVQTKENEISTNTRDLNFNERNSLKEDKQVFIPSLASSAIETNVEKTFVKEETIDMDKKNNLEAEKNSFLTGSAMDDVGQVTMNSTSDPWKDSLYSSSVVSQKGEEGENSSTKDENNGDCLISLTLPEIPSSLPPTENSDYFNSENSHYPFVSLNDNLLRNGLSDLHSDPHSDLHPQIELDQTYFGTGQSAKASIKDVFQTDPLPPIILGVPGDHEALVDHEALINHETLVHHEAPIDHETPVDHKPMVDHEAPVDLLVSFDHKAHPVDLMESVELRTSVDLLDSSESKIHDEDGIHMLEDGNFYFEIGGLPEKDPEEDMLPLGKPASKVKFSSSPIKVYSTFTMAEYDRRNEDIDPISASAEYELEKRVEKMDLHEVEIYKGDDGLGFSIIGMGVGADTGLEKLGIFIKTLAEGGPAARDGRFQVNDQIVEVNGNSLVGVTQMYAANILRSANGSVKFVLGREKDSSKSEVARLIQHSIEQERFRAEMRLQQMLEHQQQQPTNHLSSEDSASEEEDNNSMAPPLPASSLPGLEPTTLLKQSPELPSELPSSSVVVENSKVDLNPKHLHIQLIEEQKKISELTHELSKARERTSDLELTAMSDHHTSEEIVVELSEVEKKLEAAKHECLMKEKALNEEMKQYSQLESSLKNQISSLEQQYLDTKNTIDGYKQKEVEYYQERDGMMKEHLENEKRFRDETNSLQNSVNQLEKTLEESKRNALGKKLSTESVSLELPVIVNRKIEDGLASPTRSTLNSNASNELNAAIGKTELLDCSANRSKKYLASSGALASRRKPSSSNTIEELEAGSVSDMECTDDVYDVPEIQKEEKIQSFKSPQHEERLDYQHPDEVSGGSSLIDGNSGESKGVRRFRDFIFPKNKTNSKDKKKKDFQKTTNGLKGDEDFNDNIRLESIKRISDSERTNGMGDRVDYSMSDLSSSSQNSADRPSYNITLTSHKQRDDGAKNKNPMSAGYLSASTGNIPTKDRDMAQSTSSKSHNLDSRSAYQSTPALNENSRLQPGKVPVGEWNTRQVGIWLVEIELPMYVTEFKHQEITGSHLLTIDSSEMKSLGITNSKHRDLLKRKIKELKTSAEKKRKQLEKEQKIEKSNKKNH